MQYATVAPWLHASRTNVALVCVRQDLDSDLDLAAWRRLPPVPPSNTKENQGESMERHQLDSAFLLLITIVS